MDIIEQAELRRLKQRYQMLSAEMDALKARVNTIEQRIQISHPATEPSHDSAALVMAKDAPVELRMPVTAPPATTLLPGPEEATLQTTPPPAQAPQASIGSGEPAVPEHIEAVAIPVAPPPLEPSPISPTPEIISAALQTEPAPVEIPAAPEPTLPVPPPIPAMARFESPAMRGEIPRSARESELAPEQPSAPAEAEAAVETGSFEMRLGTYWLVRIGIVMVLTSIVFAGAYAYKNYVPLLGPGGKVGLMYLASGLLLGVGAWFQRKVQKAALNNYGQVLFAGGLAAVYFTTYAAHYFPNLRVITNPIVDGCLLFAWGGFMAWLSDRKKSEVMAAFSLGLAYYSSYVTQVGQFTLYSNLVLTAAAVFFMIRNQWAALSFGSLLATYGGFAFWRFHHNGGWLWDLHSDELLTGNLFLGFYWIVFTAAAFLCRAGSMRKGGRAGFATFNNVAFFSLVVLSMLHIDHGNFWKFSLGYGCVLLLLALAARRFLADELATRNAYSIQGLLLVTVGFIAKFAGLDLALVLGVESAVLMTLAIQLRNPLLSAGALVTATMATLWGLDGLSANVPKSLWANIGVCLMMLYNAVLPRFADPESPSLRARVRGGYFVALALLLCFATTSEHARNEWRGFAYALEMVAFLALSRPLRAPAMAYASYLLALPIMAHQCTLSAPLNTTSALLGSIIGALALGCAALSRWEAEKNDDDAQRHNNAALYFASVAQLVWVCTAWQSGRPELRPLLIACESTAFLFGSSWLRNPALRYGSFAAAAIGTAATVLNLSAAFEDHSGWDPTRCAIASFTGALLLFNAWWDNRRQAQPSAGANINPATAAFVAMAMTVWFLLTWTMTPAPYRAAALSVEALAFTLLWYPLALPELIWLGQLFLLAGHAQFATLQGKAVIPPPWWSGFLIVAITMGLTRWWQTQQRLPAPAAAGQCWQALLGLGTVTTLYCWLQPHVGPFAWPAVTGALALGLTAYSTVTRAWFTAGAAQLLLWHTIGAFIVMFSHRPVGMDEHSILLLAPVLLVFLLAGPLCEWIGKRVTLEPEHRTALNMLGWAYQAAGWLMALCWIHEFIPVPHRFWTLIVLAWSFYLWGQWRGTWEPLLVAGGFAAVGFAGFWLRSASPATIEWQNLAAIVGFLALQRVARKQPPRQDIPNWFHTAMIILGSCSLWLYLSRLVTIKAGGMAFYLTAAWALLALAIFSAGFLTRERVYRFHGLAILACALGRVVLLDIWKLDVFYRFLSFGALGLVLLVLGYIYTKYQDRIREWL